MERRWKRQSGGGWGQRWLEVGREGEGRSYHDTNGMIKLPVLTVAKGQVTVSY